MIKKIIKCFLTTILFFFALSFNVHAADTVNMSLPYSTSIQNKPYRLKGVNETRYLASVGIYWRGKEHSYCIQPGTPYGTGYTGNEIDFNDYKTGLIQTSSAKREAVRNILTFAVKIKDPASNSYCKTQAYKTLDSSVQKAFAAQALIWEVVVGERTKFTQVAPDVSNSSPGYSSLYKRIEEFKSGSHGTIYSEYVNIINEVQAVFNSTPKGFYATDSNALSKPATMKYDEANKKWSITLGSDVNYKYWKVKSSGDATVKISSDKVIIESTKPITNGKIILTNIIPSDRTSVEKGPKAYYFSKNQDIVTIGGKSVDKYLYINTGEKPTYQLSVTKYETGTTNPIKDVNFYVCKSEDCNSKTKIATITTNEDGIAKLTGLEDLGFYYVKEVKAPAGYEGDLKAKQIEVKSTNKTTPANIVVYNKPIILELEKYTVDENNQRTILDDGCGTEEYTGPKFSLKNKKGDLVCLKELESGKYTYTTDCNSPNTKEIKTCGGAFTISKLPECEYKITETELPKGMTIGEGLEKDVNICNSTDRAVTFTNGFVGVEFRKKNEQGELLEGGLFALQKKVDGVYVEQGVTLEKAGIYVFDENSEEKTFTTKDGIAFIKRLPKGEYRIVEKQTPSDEYELVTEDASKALFTIRNSSSDYVLTEMINRKVSASGSDASAELILTLTTGRKILNYTLIFGGLIILLGILIFIRKKYKK